MMDARKLLADCRIVPVVTIEDAATAVPLAETLLEAGLQAIEITLRTAAGIEAVRNVAREVPGIITGAGSVRNPHQLREVVAAGAGFAVSPGSSPSLLAAAADAGIPFVPGAVTATEMLVLLEHGYYLQKFFPAEQSGGLEIIRALAAPMPEVSFFATGGINAGLAPAYLASPGVACVGGSWFVPQDLLEQGGFEEISVLARQAAALDGSGDSS